MGTNKKLVVAGKTIATQPVRVLLATTSVPQVINRDHQDEPQLLVGGAGSSHFGRKSKLVRRQTAKAERHNMRTTLHHATKIHPSETDTIDIQPLRAVKVGWRHTPKKAKPSDDVDVAA